MRLPGADHPVIDPSKVQEYMLSRRHPVGRFKAAFFASLGYEADNWQELDAALRTAVLRHDAELDERTVYGQKYRVRSILEGPTGRSASIVSIWILLHGETAPRLVTVMPAR